MSEATAVIIAVVAVTAIAVAEAGVAADVVAEVVVVTEAQVAAGPAEASLLAMDNS